ncbi:MAG: prephenate/arogenate dehydrogenase family protein [Alphaproteobacteria bacterium]|nr:prephenate/arogenate dehydrogenase family protein [Alphaproteobacteria bacterium]
MNTDPSSAPIFGRISVIGVGLIGSSLVRAAMETGAAQGVSLWDQDPSTLARAAELGLGEPAASLSEAVSQADAVFLCMPVGALAATGALCAGSMKSGAILTDVGSVKASVARDLRTLSRPGLYVIPGHPIAGTEKSGPDAGFASLFRGRWCILTPEPDGDEAYLSAVAALTRFWERLGSRVETMDAARHDLVLAITSHVPHLIAYNICSTAADLEQVTQGEVVKFSAAGFRDFTRIAASDPTMWRDVFLNNREAVLEILGRFNEDLTALQRAIRWGEGDLLFDVFTRARGVRKSIIEAGQDTAAPNFGRDSPAAPKP